MSVAPITSNIQFATQFVNPLNGIGGSAQQNAFAAFLQAQNPGVSPGHAAAIGPHTPSGDLRSTLASEFADLRTSISSHDFSAAQQAYNQIRNTLHSRLGHPRQQHTSPTSPLIQDLGNSSSDVAGLFQA